METYAKLYRRILDSSVWKLPSDVRIVWITLLALKDENGCIMGSEGWLADVARVGDEICHKAIRTFLAPDKRSRTVTNDGRKIEAIEGGWRVLNHELYRDGIEQVRDKWRRQKAAQRARKNSTTLPGENAYIRSEDQATQDRILDEANERATGNGDQA